MGSRETRNIFSPFVSVMAIFMLRLNVLAPLATGAAVTHSKAPSQEKEFECLRRVTRKCDWLAKWTLDFQG